MDYQQLLGVKDLAVAAQQGRGVKVAILDSGTPHLYLHGGVKSASFPNGKLGRDDFGHASEVSSILFGCSGIDGICPNAEPCYIKVLDSHGNGTLNSVVTGIDKAIELGADLINLSVGFIRTDICPRSLEKACRRAYSSGMTLVCASGNDGSRVNWPAALDTTICVGASDKNGLRAAFSSHGEVDVIAPGVDLMVRDACGVMQHVSGTSFSAAIITGISALLIADAKLNSSSFSPELLRSKLAAMAHDVGPEGCDSDSGYGVISGLFDDHVSEQKIKVGFFDKIAYTIQGLFGLVKKGVQNGRV